MSWSVGAVGKPVAVKAALATQFASAIKNTAGIPHESESVVLVEKIVNGQLDFLAALESPQAVTVMASGSAWKPVKGPGGSSQVEMKVTPISGFVE